MTKKITTFTQLIKETDPAIIEKAISSLPNLMKKFKAGKKTRFHINVSNLLKTKAGKELFDLFQLDTDLLDIQAMNGKFICVGNQDYTEKELEILFLSIIIIDYIQPKKIKYTLNKEQISPKNYNSKNYASLKIRDCVEFFLNRKGNFTTNSERQLKLLQAFIDKPFIALSYREITEQYNETDVVVRTLINKLIEHNYAYKDKNEKLYVDLKNAVINNKEVSFEGDLEISKLPQIVKQGFTDLTEFEAALNEPCTLNVRDFLDSDNKNKKTTTNEPELVIEVPEENIEEEEEKLLNELSEIVKNDKKEIVPEIDYFRVERIIEEKVADKVGDVLEREVEEAKSLLKTTFWIIGVVFLIILICL